MTLQRPTPETLRQMAESFGFALDAATEAAFAELMDDALDAHELVDREWARRAPSPPERRWATPAPEDNPLGAWAVRSAIREADAGPLAGKRLAIKNNINVAGLPMVDGSRLLDGNIAQEDATVVRRALAAGATIVGTTVCEDLCVSGASHTAASGPVRNPWNPEHSSGGSSSGNAVVVATGEADMAIGGDQGGSVRVPAAWSGLVGLKPTHGLVPYTGALPIELTHDHLGPMAMTVADVALLLSVIAGADGLDPRQVAAPAAADYTAGLDGGVSGLRIGLLAEGFGQANGEAAVDAAVRAAAERLGGLGAELVEVSVPEHRTLGPAVWSVILTDGLVWQMLRGNGYGMNHRGRYDPAVMSALAAGRRERFDEVSPAVKFAALVGQYAIQRFDGTHYAKAQNLALDLRAAYDRAFEQVDVLCLPTAPMTATRTPPADAPVADYVRRTVEMMNNTAPFDTAGHPAISIPVVMTHGLPVGMMLVGPHFGEPAVLRCAAAYEAAVGGFPRAPTPTRRTGP
jgi:amidase